MRDFRSSLHAPRRLPLPLPALHARGYSRAPVYRHRNLVRQLLFLRGVRVNERLTESLPSPRAANAIPNQDGVFAKAELYL